MPEIRTAEEAADRAEKFLGRYYAFRTLKSASKEGRSWKLVYDTSIVPIAESLVEITIDASTGDVMGYGKVKG